MRKITLLLLFHFALFAAFSAKSADIMLEAENGTLDGVEVYNWRAAYSGIGYVGGFDNGSDKITWTFNVPTSGIYTVKLSYASPWGDKGFGFLVNGVEKGGMLPQSENWNVTSVGRIQFNAGENTIVLSNGWGYYDVDYVQLSPYVPVATSEITLEGEEGSLNGVYPANYRTGYSGSGFLTGFDSGSDQVSWTFDGNAGLYELQVGYASPWGAKGFGIVLNGVYSEGMFQQSEGFSTIKVGNFYLKSGQNSLIITNGWGYYDLDFVKLVPAKVVNIPLEAENATLNGVEAHAYKPGYSGTGFVTGFDNPSDIITWNVAADAGLYELRISYSSPWGLKGFGLRVNGISSEGMFQPSESFTEMSAGNVYLTSGINEIAITTGWGYYDLDYIKLVPAQVLSPITPSASLVDSKALPTTRALYRYLLDLYGKKSLSSQQDNLDYIQAVTGKEVAVASHDLMDYSPSRVEFGHYPAGYVESMINWAKGGNGNGIVSLCWHWNAPTDLINEAPDKLWWSGFYTHATTFDIAAALADTTSERYKLIIRDLDAIAVELKKFQDADLPVLWRPLHEASGAWFWWGAKGPEPFKALWRLMYDRYTKVHQLHNLIWVFTAGPETEWYPGNEYVDVLSQDIYAGVGASMSAQWESMRNLQNAFSTGKIVALSETGNLPDPDKVRAYGTWWSWFSNWGGGAITTQDTALVRKAFLDEDVITRDEVIDWRSTYNVAPTVSFTSPVNGSVITFGQSLSVSASAEDEGSDVKVTLFVDGSSVGIDASAPYAYSVSGLSAGAHTLVVVAEDALGAQASDTITVSVNAAPEVSLSADQTNYEAPATIVLNASASDSDGSIASVDFYNGSALIGSSTSAPYTLTLTSVAAGSYSFKAVATDDKGAIDSASVVVSVEMPDVIGADCGVAKGVEIYELNPKFVAGADKIKWQIHGPSKIEALNSSNSKVKVTFDKNFKGEVLYVEVKYKSPSRKVELTKEIAACVPSSSSEVELSVSPNPTYGQVNITAGKSIFSLQVLNSTGEVVYSKGQVSSKTHSFVIGSNNAKGIYKLIITFADATTESKTIILQ